MDSFPETIPDLLRRRAADAASGPWLFFGADSWTLADVVGQADRFAVGLADRGVGRQDRVALLLGNTPETLFAWFGANLLGAIAAPVHAASKPPEIAALLRLTTPRVVVVADEHRPAAQAALDGLEPGARPELAAPRDLATAGGGAPRVDVRPDDIAVLLATSGTTGAPKAVAQTHRTYALTAEAFPWWLGLGASDRLLTALPLSHVNAQAYSTMGALGAGAGLALLPRFSASGFFDEARRLGATQFNAVGAMIHILLKGEPRPADRAHSVRLAYTALALPQAQHRAFEDRFGLAMTVGYGLSES